VTAHIWISDSSSALVPIVEPITDSWVKNTRLSSAPGLNPVVAPDVTTTPPGLSDLMLCDQVASPTVSMTPSTRSGSRAPVSNACSAPSASAAARFSSLRPVTHIR
jgi:hypothetical protein